MPKAENRAARGSTLLRRQIHFKMICSLWVILAFILRLARNSMLLLVQLRIYNKLMMLSEYGLNGKKWFFLVVRCNMNLVRDDIPHAVSGDHYHITVAHAFCAPEDLNLWQVQYLLSEPRFINIMHWLHTPIFKEQTAQFWPISHCFIFYHVLI